MSEVFKLTAAPILAAEAEHTLAKVLRSRVGNISWGDVRGMIAARRVLLGDELCLDPARRVHEGELLELLAQSRRLDRAATPAGLSIRHLDEHVVILEKPSGVSSVRHPAELAWTAERKLLQPTLHDLAQLAIGQQLGRNPNTLLPLRIVHRLDKETSGLLVFARSVSAERALGQQFRNHTVVRRYFAIVPGFVKAQTMKSVLIRDRGDGRRGSTNQPDRTGKEAITHIAVEDRFPRHTMLSCRLETGRTHQIRIHLSEAGHPVCGEKVYTRNSSGEPLPETATAPRLALHATELGFEHPVTGETLHWKMDLPTDLKLFVDRLRAITGK